MKAIFLSTMLLASQLLVSQNTIKGKVINSQTDEPLVGATIFLKNTFYATSSNIKGEFTLEVGNKKSSIICSFIGFESDTVEFSNDIEFKLTPKAFQNDLVLIEATRVSDNAPATKTNVNKEDIEELNLGQDIPYLLMRTPSLISTSDAGTGIGYTGFRIRGSDASRINVTVNGIPLNDAESHGVFWVNMPDFASNLENIQIQRGLGTSTNGAGAFGATVNLQTNALNEKAYGEVNNSFGSFNSRKHTVQFGTGLINNHFAFEGRLSNIQSDGYIDRARADLNSYFASGAYYGEKTIVKAIIFGGNEVTYQSWYGTPESRFKGNVKEMNDYADRNFLNDRDRENLLNSGRTYNFYLYDNQVDNYSQDHYQLHISHQFSEKLTSNLAFHYTIGEGYFEEFREGDALSNYKLDNVQIGNETITNTDLVRRRWLDNDFYGFTFSNIYDLNDKLNIVLGGGLNRYVGDHFGEVIWAKYASNGFLNEQYYFNKGDKIDGNIYLKANYELSEKASFLVDLQIRAIDYSAEGDDNDLRTIDIEEDFRFFNPKIGFNYQFNEGLRSYIFAGIGHREPNRADFVDGIDFLPPTYEVLRNVELGIERTAEKYLLALNLFLMDYDNQLVNTGQLNDVGSPIRQNVDRSYRKGIEFQSAYRFSKKLELHLTATFSQNKILSFTEQVYDYTLNDVFIWEIDRGTTNISFSPEIIANAEVIYRPVQNLEMAIMPRYVGKQFLDNTSSRGRMIEDYLVTDFRMAWRIPVEGMKNVSFNLLISNVFSKNYASNGYTFNYVVGQQIVENFYYPQAFRNYLIGLNLKF